MRPARHQVVAAARLEAYLLSGAWLGCHERPHHHRRADQECARCACGYCLGDRLSGKIPRTLLARSRARIGHPDRDNPSRSHCRVAVASPARPGPDDQKPVIAGISPPAAGFIRTSSVSKLYQCVRFPCRTHVACRRPPRTRKVPARGLGHLRSEGVCGMGSEEQPGRGRAVEVILSSTPATS